MGKVSLVRVHTPSETIEIPGERVIGVGFTTTGCPTVQWRDPASKALVRMLGGAIEIHEDESEIVVPTLQVVPGMPGGRG